LLLAAWAFFILFFIKLLTALVAVILSRILIARQEKGSAYAKLGIMDIKRATFDSRRLSVA